MIDIQSQDPMLETPSGEDWGGLLILPRGFWQWALSWEPLIQRCARQEYLTAVLQQFGCCKKNTIDRCSLTNFSQRWWPEVQDQCLVNTQFLIHTWLWFLCPLMAEREPESSLGSFHKGPTPIRGNSPCITYLSPSLKALRPPSVVQFRISGYKRGGCTRSVSNTILAEAIIRTAL